MRDRINTTFDRLTGLDATSDGDRVLLAERANALIPRMPWLYGMLIVNLWGLLESARQANPLRRSTGFFLLAVIVARLVHWLRLRGRAITPAHAAGVLRQTFFFCTLFCILYGAMLFALEPQAGNAEERHYVVLFGSLAALGCAKALSPFPVAARMPLFVLAVPLAGSLMLSSRTPNLGVGLTLVGLIFLTFRLLHAQNVTFTRLVQSRLDIEVQKQRAEQAEKKAMDEKSTATQLADTDPLTGLANRRALLAAVGKRAAASSRFAIVLIDLDGFKPVNDTFGHASGDALLVAVGRRLRALVGQRCGMVARLGGDEFALLLDDNRPPAVEALVAQAIERIAEPEWHDGRQLIVSACAGVAFTDEAHEDPGQLIRMADMALFSAKRSGRGTVAIFSSELESEVKRRAELELALRSPGVAEEIEIAYQPIVDLATMEVRSFEALARWRHSELGWIPPSEFIPITEQISLVETISEALLSRAARETVAWPDSTCLSFNLSGVQLCSDGSADRIIRLLRDSGLPPSRLQIEVTETAMLVDFDTARRNLSCLREHGVQLALDDFGAGYASISYLREMHFDAIKLDGSLITSAAAGEHGLALLKGVLELCRAVGLPCIAEHVETRGQATMLRELGCRFGQGYWLARPMSAARASKVAQSDVVRVAPGSQAGHWPEGPELLRGRA